MESSILKIRSALLGGRIQIDVSTISAIPNLELDDILSLVRNLVSPPLCASPRPPLSRFAEAGRAEVVNVTNEDELALRTCAKHVGESFTLAQPNVARIEDGGRVTHCIG